MKYYRLIRWDRSGSGGDIPEELERGPLERIQTAAVEEALEVAAWNVERGDIEEWETPGPRTRAAIRDRVAAMAASGSGPDDGIELDRAGVWCLTVEAV